MLRPSTTPENRGALQLLTLQALKIFYDARVALLEMPAGERLIHLFWLLGPFILLVERTPADIWLSLLALAFVFRSVVKRDGAWLGVWWVGSCFLFLLVCIVSSLFSSLPGYALQESLIWFRFPLFAMATVFWLARDKRLFFCDDPLDRHRHDGNDRNPHCGDDCRGAEGWAAHLAL